LLCGTSDYTSSICWYVRLTLFSRFTAQWKDIPRAADVAQKLDAATFSYLLRNLEVEDELDSRLERRSIVLKKQEEEIDRLRIPQLEAVGFSMM
jgi:hypothetical protein